MRSSEHVVRIGAGKLRGRLLNVIDANGLRPTPDRVRESVFNWIGDKCKGARALDLFAGSGAMGFEAWSRGASRVTLVEKNPECAMQLAKEADGLNGVEIVNDDAISYLEKADGVFSLVFLDPPYSSDLLGKSLKVLISKNLLDNDSLIYVEMSSSSSVSVPGYACLKEQVAGKVKYAIWKKSSLLF